MKKKNCIITGGTSGLGLALAKKFIDKAVALNPTLQNEEIQKLIDNKL